MWWLAGTQVPADDIAVVPPRTPDFSSTITFAPFTAAASAAASPAAPEPTTITSQSAPSETATSEAGMKVVQEVEHVMHRHAQRALERRFVGRQVGALEHDRVDLGMLGEQRAAGGDCLALDGVAIQGQAVA